MTPDIDAIRALKQLDYQKLLKGLTSYACYLCYKRGVSGYRSVGEDTLLPKGESPLDIASQAITDTLIQERPWNKEKYSNIEQHLRWVVNSMVSNLADSKESKTTKTFSGMIPAGVSNEDADEWLAHAEDMRDFRKISDLNEDEAKEFVNSVFDEICGDEDLERILECSLSGLAPNEIQKKLNIPIERVYQLCRKLKRKMEKVGKLRGGEIPGGGYAERRN